MPVEEPPRRRREIKAILISAIVLVVIVVVYLAVDYGFRSAPELAPPKESPATEAPHGTESPEPEITPRGGTGG